MNKTKKLLAACCLLGFMGAVAILHPISVGAQDSIVEVPTDSNSCGPANLPYYTGTTSLPIGTYDVYVKLGKTGQNIPVQAFFYTDNNEASCTAIGATEASSDTWKEVGAYSSSDSSTAITFQLSSEALQDLPDANRPTLMFIPQSDPVCVPKAECETTIDGQTAYIQPNGIALGDNALNILRVKSLEGDTVTHVEYYADSELLYETKQLEPFNGKIVPYYATKLYRVIYYASGQKAVIESQATTIVDNSLLASTVLRLYKHYEQILKFVGIALAAAIILLITHLTLLAFERRRKWRLAHGFTQPKATRPLTAKDIRRMGRVIVFKKISRIFEIFVFCASAIIIIVLSVGTYVIQLNTVNGYSMETTFQDGQRVTVNKWPVTFARLNGHTYTPKRGDVVIAYPNFGTNLSADQVNDDETIIKRVIGLPGERVVIDQDEITIYNKEYPDGFDPQANTSWQQSVITDTSQDQIDITLGIDQVFLCGDNRPVSIDSRYNGPVTTSQIVGVVVQ